METDVGVKVRIGNVRIGRARAAFLQMKNIFTSSKPTINIKIRIF